MRMQRRTFLNLLAPAAAAAALPGAAFAQRAAKPRPTLIAVYLRGGADALGIVVPYSDKDLSRHRPTLAMKSGPESDPKSVLVLDDKFGFNPRMKELYSLWKQNLCVPIVAVGSPHDTRSHFDAQDFMERAAPGSKDVYTGWLNRYLDATKSSVDATLRAISLQPLLPRSLRGPYPVLAKPDQKAEQAMQVFGQLYMQGGSSGGSARTTKTASKSGAGQGGSTRQAIEEFGAKTIQQLWELNQVLDNSPAPTVSYPRSGFGRQMSNLAKLIKAERGFEVTAIDYGGWDHHVNEAPVDGQLGRMLGDVSGTLGAFVEDLGPDLVQNTMVLIMSEFGRTVRENDNQGTDHGHGGFMLAVGGRLNGGKVYGKWTDLADNNINQNRDLPVHTDFRDVFAEVLQGMYGFDGYGKKLFPRYDASSGGDTDFMKNA